jgi:UDP-3-O-[3-hydroxymyristoyl] glucosamine N-acyltransferase
MTSRNISPSAAERSSKAPSNPLRPTSLFATDGRAASAQVHASARIEAGVTIDALAVIGPRAQIGAETVIAAGAAIGPDVCLGRRCAVGAGATIVHALLGDGVVIQPGARIGQAGFGAPEAQQERIFPQTGRVIIQDDVEIGANAAIDRGAARDTVIGEGTKVSNLVQIGHGAMIGRHCLIAAQADIAAGMFIGDFAIIGRLAGVADDVGSGAGGTRAGRVMVNSDNAGETGSGGSAALPRGGDR